MACKRGVTAPDGTDRRGRLLEDQSRQVGSQQPDELLGNQWPAEVVALSLATPLGLKKRELLSRFHTFRDDAMPEALAHADHGADNGGAHRYRFA